MFIKKTILILVNPEKQYIIKTNILDYIFRV